MNEQIRPNTELTGGAISHTLDTRRNMSEPQKEITTNPGQSSAQHEAPSTARSERPEVNSLAEMLSGSQAGREVARAMVDEARASGRSLTSEQREFIRSTGLVPMLVGGADVPENDDFNPRNEDENTRPSHRRREIMGSPQDRISDEGITHPDLRALLASINNPRGLNAEEFLDAIEIINDLQSTDSAYPIPENQRSAIAERLTETASILSAQQERIGFYLQDSDRAQLMIDPQKWLDSKFDLIYLAAQSGQELDSQMLQGAQQLVGDANQFLARRLELASIEGNIPQREKYRNFVDIFNRTFGARINLLVTRTMIDRGGMEQVVKQFGQLRTDGLMGSLSFDDGRVGVMFNRMDEFLEDIRIAEGGKEFHLTPEMVSGLQKRVEEEQFLFAQNSAGMFSEEFERIKRINKLTEVGISSEEREKRRINSEETLRSEIRRAVRTAYDIFVSSQRLGVINARGRHLSGVDRYMSDPGGAFGFFNAEDSNIGKWGFLNEEQEKFLKYTQMDMALSEPLKDPTEKLTQKQLETRGRRLWRDLSAAPDFYSSGWRIKAMLLQIEKITLYKVQNQKIIEGLLVEPADSAIGIKFGEYYVGRLAEARREQIAGADSPEFKKIVAQEFAKGISIVSTSKVLSGLNLEERRSYMNHLRLNQPQLATEARQKAQEFALFMHIKNPSVALEVFGSPNSNPVERKKQEDAWQERTWNTIKIYRPEEIMRLVRERMDPDDRNDERTLSQLNSVFSEVGGSYDQFKLKYGGVLKTLREAGFREGVGKQLDMRNLSTEQKTIINRVMRVKEGDNLDYAERVSNVYRKMSQFIDGNNIVKALLTSWRYEDTYTRTLIVDDTLSDQMEYPPENSGITRLSRFFSSDPSKDPLARTGGDLSEQEKAIGFNIGVITKEDDESILKDAEGQATATKNFNGPQDAARAFRYTFGSRMRFSLQDYWPDILQIGKLPNRWASSELERVFGPGMKPMTSEEARGQLDHVRSWLTGTGPEAHKFYLDLEHKLRADAKRRIGDRVFGLGIYALIALAFLPLAVAAKAASETASK